MYYSNVRQEILLISSPNHYTSVYILNYPCLSILSIYRYMERNIIWRYIFKRSSFTKSLRDSFLTFSNFTAYPKHRGVVFYIFYHSSYQKNPQKQQSQISKPIFQNQMELHFTKRYYYTASLYTELSSHVHWKIDSDIYERAYILYNASGTYSLHVRYSLTLRSFNSWLVL